MFLRIVRVRSTEQSGIKGVKILFDPNIIDMQYNKKPGWFFKYHIFLEFGKYQVRSVLFSLNLITDIIVDTLPGNFSWISGSFDLFFNCLI